MAIVYVGFDRANNVLAMHRVDEAGRPRRCARRRREPDCANASCRDTLPGTYAFEQIVANAVLGNEALP